jgi:hypothetical protein
MEAFKGAHADAKLVFLQMDAERVLMMMMMMMTGGTERACRILSTRQTNPLEARKSKLSSEHCDVQTSRRKSLKRHTDYTDCSFRREGSIFNGRAKEKANIISFTRKIDIYSLAQRKFKLSW